MGVGGKEKFTNLLEGLTRLSENIRSILVFEEVLRSKYQWKYFFCIFQIVTVLNIYYTSGYVYLSISSSCVKQEQFASYQSVIVPDNFPFKIVAYICNCTLQKIIYHKNGLQSCPRFEIYLYIKS